ncbi:cell division protein ZapA [Dyella solisilvae]|uniref:Cell division protein ZapA n=1 Tax=Dyella solisilvae TaxID=1920168 RepID=A0A370K762_9GAMM|nr:cell division protein ZapA [Dyella solisilvae]RDI98498.1 cell division protein ZapA [Dyella solisilvae]
MAENNAGATPNEPVALRLVDREFLIACAPEEREGLLESAAYLDRKMRELRANARAPGFDRLAVLAAISVTHEFLALRKQHTGTDQSVTDGLANLRRKLEAALDAHIK